MSLRVRILSAALIVTVARLGAAQGVVRSTQTDPRWYPWLGCWAGDTAGGSSARAGVSCIVPLSGTSGVEALTLVNGRIVSRQRIEATGRTQPVDNQGCSGLQQANWSPSGRRVYVRSDYTCNTGVAGTSQSMFAFSARGEFLRIEDVRAGDGTPSMVRAERQRDVGIPAGLPSDAAATLESRRLSIETSRAAASRALNTDDVVEALRHVDAPVVRSWLYQTGQRFELSGQQINALARADVPSTVLQAMMGNSPVDQPVAYGDTAHAVQVYRGSVINAAPMYPPMYPEVYQPEAYQPPVSQPSYSPYPYSNYNSYSYLYPYSDYYGYYYPVMPYYPRRVVHTSPPVAHPFVGVRAPASGVPHSVPFRPTQPVTHGPSGRPSGHRP
jgi:hypothetical protein